MSLDPEIAQILGPLDAGFPQVEMMTGPQARAAVRARIRQPDTSVPVGRVEERIIAGPATDLRIRIYWPTATFEAPVPIVVFAHGGGFVFCDLDSHDDLCRRMCNGVGALVISVEYRLAPENPWPAAPEDVYTATVWASHNAHQLGGDPDRVVIAGDSAGGNLAAVTTLLARDRGGPTLSAQLLIYPVVAADFDTTSYRDFASGYYNTRAAMQWYWAHYVPNHADRKHPFAAPLHADLAGLPPAVVVTANYDPLATEGTHYANLLAAAGIPVIHRSYPAVHGFLSISSLTVARLAHERAWTDLNELLRSAVSGQFKSGCSA